MNLTILHTNDFHGGLNPERLLTLKDLRSKTDLYLDGGDAVTFGNVAVPIAPDPVWPRLAELNCDASVPGNREFHVLAPVFRSKLAGLAHPMICANLFQKDGERMFPPSVTLERAGKRIGIVGGMVPMVTGRMAARHVSACLMTPPVPAIAEEANRLRPKVDVLIALTHIGLRRDRELALACPELDMILSAHSHDLLPPEKIGEVWIAQTGSHGRYAGLWTWDGETLAGDLMPLPSGKASSRSRPR